MTLRFTILGCGSSGGVPRVGPHWGKCDPANPKNRRLRCSLLIERMGSQGTTRVLVDTSPDCRQQLLGAEVAALDGVLYTHDHADHTHGIDDLRMVAFAMKKRIDVFADAATLASLTGRFSYCFEKAAHSSYPAILEAHEIAPGTLVSIEGAGGPIEATPIAQEHGLLPSLGFRFGSLAYSPDISGIPDAAVPLLDGLDVWVVDALRHSPHPTHFHLDRALEWVERLAVERAILTHMTTDLDYETLRRELPEHVEPAYDGMVVELD